MEARRGRPLLGAKNLIVLWKPACGNGARSATVGDLVRIRAVLCDVATATIVCNYDHPI